MTKIRTPVTPLPSLSLFFSPIATPTTFGSGVEARFRDVDALEAACAELGFELLRDTDARGFANSTRHGELVVRLNGPYDIAANRTAPTEPYELSTDWWNGHVEREVGPNFGRLLQLYGVHKTMREAAKKHLRVTRRQETDGSIKLTLAA